MIIGTKFGYESKKISLKKHTFYAHCRNQTHQDRPERNIQIDVSVNICCGD